MAPERKATPEDDGELFVWRTQRDARVRLEHRRLEGRLLSRRELDEIGWPDSHFGCRCEVVPHRQGETEFANQELTTTINEKVQRWDSFDFAYHYYFGNGKTVYLSDVGHLPEVVEHFSFGVEGTGRLRAWAGQIAAKAREAGVGALQDDFERGYNFETVAFAHGKSDVFGLFQGQVYSRGRMLRIEGSTRFSFRDTFTDPADIRQRLFDNRDRLPDDWTELGGTAYLIADKWHMTFLAEVNADSALSGYVEE